MRCDRDQIAKLALQGTARINRMTARRGEQCFDGFERHTRDEGGLKPRLELLMRAERAAALEETHPMIDGLIEKGRSRVDLRRRLGKAELRRTLLARRHAASGRPAVCAR